ncbi:MAG: restriction endonuclease [Microbacteriaceae bacterium]
MAKRAWLVRSVKSGIDDDLSLNLNRSIIGFEDVGDLGSHETREDFVDALNQQGIGNTPSATTNYAGQLYNFVKNISIGDYIVMPLRNEPQIAVGEVTGGYEYYQAPNQKWRHTRQVRWLQQSLPRTAVQQDLLYSMGAFMTIAELKRNQAASRIENLAAKGIDLGQKISTYPSTHGDFIEVPGIAEGDETDYFDLLRVNLDLIAARLKERFDGHELAELIGAILEVKGFKCTVSKPGADGGVDIIAGGGPLGLDSPKLVVQVKSETSAVGDPVVQQLHGSIQRNDAEQGLLVAFGGLTKQAQTWLAGERFRIAVWDADDIIQQIFETYTDLPEAIRSKLPLKNAWVLDESGSSDS